MKQKKIKDSLGERMKSNYEFRSKTCLLRRTPCIIRLDGKAFHTFTRGFAKPFDERFLQAMQETTVELCKSIQGCVLGYTESDEITLVLVDYANLDSEAWFDYEVQKMCSVSASMATFYFNRAFEKFATAFMVLSGMREENKSIADSYKRAIEMGGFFDSRCFNVPISEVTNCILWRQKDAERCSINSIGQAYFSHSQLQGKSLSQVQDMLYLEHSINWNYIETYKKRGTCVVKDGDGHWIIDREMPILVGEGRNYVESRINFEDGDI